MSVPRLQLHAAVLFFIILCLVRPATAEDNDQTAVPLRHDVVVTAARMETPLREVANSITVVTRADLERTNQTSVLKALRDTIGLTVVQNGGPGSSSSVFLRGANSEHVLVLLDGVPLNDPINPSRNFDLAHLTFDGIDRVEILRGPQSTLYGSDALGGVINILTARGAGKPAVTLRASGGSFGTFNSGLDLRGSTGPFHYSLDFSRASTRGVSAAGTAYAGNTEADGYRNWTLAGRAGLKLDGGTEIDLVFRGISAATDLDLSGGAYGDDPNSIQRYLSGFLRAQARTLLAGGRWESILGISHIRSSRRGDNPVDNLHPLDSETSHYRSSRNRLDWQNNIFLGSGHTLTAGAEFERETGDSEYFSESAWGPYSSVFPGRKDDRAGVFLQDRFNISGVFHAAAGIRLDSHSRTGTALTWRLAPAVVFDRTGTKIKATVGTAFKAPSLYQLFAPGTFWGPVGNESLLPEESLGWDAGLEQTLAGGAVLLGLSYFQSDFRNLINYDYALGYVNIGRARSRGWEAAVDARPFERLTFRCAYTRLDARDLDTGEPLLRRPGDKISGSIQWVPSSGWEVGLAAVYTGIRPDLDYSGWTPQPVMLPSFFLVDAYLTFAVGAGLEVFGRWENIGNVRYETVFGYGTPGSAVTGGVKILF
ncbi:MAG: TonB-dependent receptor [Candidatus Aminicenantes bacterium]|nr:TonB-dependent receptor [Candidatus Aminicenantes bacterium]